MKTCSELLERFPKFRRGCTRGRELRSIQRRLYNRFLKFRSVHSLEPCGDRRGGLGRYDRLTYFGIILSRTSFSKRSRQNHGLLQNEGTRTPKKGPRFFWL